jgi:hypothetical protein
MQVSMTISGRMMNMRNESSGNDFRVLGSSRKAELQVDVVVQMPGKRRPVETGTVPWGQPAPATSSPRKTRPLHLNFKKKDSSLFGG